MKLKTYEKMRRSADERHVKEHTESYLRRFDTHGGLCQSKEIECV